jgi:uncharacterized protein YukE
MAQAIVDPDELLTFASDLFASAHRSRITCAVASAEFSRLGEVWRDDNHRTFADSFQASISRMQRFADDAEDYADFLRRKARLAEEYLRP